MKFEKLLEKYRAVCTDRDELRAQLMNRDQQIKDACRYHDQTRARISDAVRILSPQPQEAEQVNQASGPGYQASPRMGSPKLERVERPMTCPHCRAQFNLVDLPK